MGHFSNPNYGHYNSLLIFIFVEEYKFNENIEILNNVLKVSRMKKLTGKKNIMNMCVYETRNTY